MKYLCLLVALAALLPGTEGFAATANPPQFREVFEIVRTNLGGMNPEAVERAALKALLTQLDGQVVIEGQPAAKNSDLSGPVVSKSAVFDDGFGYVRINHVGAKLDEALSAEFGKLGGPGKLRGLVLDLRYAGGADEKAAARAADRFIPAEQALLTVNGESLRSSTKTNAIQLPTAILVNHHTSGAAEVLAALLRQHKVGLLIGTATTGGARQFKEFTLSTGQRLRIATGETKLADGQLMPSTGLRPDIAVNVGAEEERVFYAEPYRSLGRVKASPSADKNNAESKGRLNEAELVRRMNEGQSLETALAEGAPSVTLPQVRDPALARALDLLKGLVVVRQSRSP